MIRRYPYLKAKYSDLHTQAITPSYAESTGRSGVSRTAEVIALRELPTTEQREYEAVARAIAETERYANGRDRLRLIRLVLWDRSHTLEGAALCIPCGVATAWRWHGEFIKLVARFYGLLDK